MGEVGVGVRVRCVKPGPLWMAVCPLLGVILSWVGLVQVDPWVRVDTGGGCPRPWEEEGLRLGLGILTLSPEEVAMCPSLGFQVPKVG